MTDLTTTEGPLGLAPDGDRPRRTIHGGVFVLVGLVALTVTGLMLFAELDRLAIGGLTILLLILLLALSVPISIAMIASSAIGLYALAGQMVAATSTQSVVFDGVASWTLSVVPLFVLMGIALWKGGVTSAAYRAARHCLGWLPGGLAVATTFAGAGLASTSGSTMGITFALGKISIPEMLRAGYKSTLATGSVAMAGTLGQIIPPSILLVIYAGVAEVPVGPQLLAGIVPGLMLTFGFALIIVLWALANREAAPSARLEGGWSERFRSLVEVIPLIIVGAVVLGGMLGGFFTATEAAAIGAVVAMVVSWVTFGKGHRGWRRTWRFFSETVMEAAGSVAGLFIIVVGAYLLTRVLTLSGLAQELTVQLVGLDLNRVQLLLLLIVVYIFLGMFLESLPMILLTVPLLQPALEAMGVDMIWYGIFIVIMCEIGMVFPPIGLLTFVVHRIVQDPQVNLGQRISLIDVFKGVMPFVAVAIAVTVALIQWPDIVLWLPEASLR